MAPFLKFILVILGIYLIGKAIFRGLFSFLFGDVPKNLNEQQTRQQHQKLWQQEEVLRQKRQKEGSVTINYQPKSDKNFKKNEGDYVDFEEVK
jgi:hypothetical protein